MNLYKFLTFFSGFFFFFNLKHHNLQCQDVNLMSLNYDSKGNCIPTILLMMQDRLYSQGDLKVSITKPLNVQTVGIFMLTLQY
jgi:hypothetical protein